MEDLMLRITDPVFAMLYRLGAIPEKYFKIIIDRYVETSFAYDPVFEEEELNNVQKRRMPVIHNMDAKAKRETDQIKNYLDTKNKKYADIETRMRKMGKPDAMAYYNSLKTQESKERPRKTLIITESQMRKLLALIS